MQDGMDFSIVVFIILAAFVGWRLYNVLGTRPDRDAPQIPTKKMKNPGGKVEQEDNVISLSDHSRGTEQDISEPAGSKDRWKGIAEKGTPLAASLDALNDAERGFDANAFLEGAKMAYETIVLGFAAGDRQMLKSLLSRDVFESFVSAIADREKKGETIETTFVSLDAATIQDVHLKGRTATISVEFVSKLITATKNRDGAVIEGSREKVADVTDIWTFSREVGSKDPSWRLVATEAAG
ncbi:MAG: Tim44/TimA family putative adaptor protein [Hyphomicrobiales bacterium]